MAVRAVVVGSLVMDLAFSVPTRPGPGEVIVATNHGRYRGGKGYNQAVALARLGAEVVFVGAVGSDRHGDEFLEALEREHVDASHVVQLRGVSTGMAVPLITPDGSVGFVQYPGANWQLGTGHVADLPDGDVLLLQGEVSGPASEYAARVMRRRGVPVLLNTAPVQEVSAQLLDAATVLCANEVEARALVERSGVTVTTDEQLAVVLARPGRPAIVTLGAGGAVWSDGARVGSVAPPPVAAVDATGAGDAFCGALALWLGEDAGLEDAVRMACAAGAFCTTQRGAEPSMPSRGQVESLLAASST